MNKDHVIILAKIEELKTYLSTTEILLLYDIEHYIIEDDREIEQLKEEIKTLYRYTPEKGFELVGGDEE